MYIIVYYRRHLEPQTGRIGEFAIRPAKCGRFEMPPGNISTKERSTAYQWLANAFRTGYIVRSDCEIYICMHKDMMKLT